MGSAIAGAVGLAVLAAAPAAQAAITVRDLNNGATAESLAQSVAGPGVTISNVTFTGDNAAAGRFAGGADSIGFDGGIILDSGKVQTVVGDPPCARGVEGPNGCYENGGPDGVSNSTDFGLPGDTDLTALSGFPTFDATVLEFDFVPASSSVQFNYVFASEEYSDYANQSFNDVFAFFVNGANCATVPGTGEPVSVNTINNGNDSGGDATPHNPQLFRDNVNPSPSIDTEMDGLTTVLTCETSVNAGQPNHMKLAIADADDGAFDSAVFLQGLPLPIPNQTVNVRVIEGIVLIKRPGETDYTPLEAPEQIPVGSQLDTTNGKVEIESASDFSGGVRTGQFYDGVFEVTQKPKGSTLETVLDLVPKVGCGKKARDGGPPAIASRKKKGNGLWGSESGGGHKTKGKKGSGSTRGTVWFVGDRCNGTTVGKVKEGKIKFRDFKKHKTITLKAGESYVAGK